MKNLRNQQLLCLKKLSLARLFAFILISLKANSRKHLKTSLIFFSTLPNENKFCVEVTPEALDLAKTYISENVVGQTSFDDCVHIALATIHKVDILVSWNFKHIANVYRIRGYNTVNLRMGYTPLEIRSPKDIVSDENED